MNKWVASVIIIMTGLVVGATRQAELHLFPTEAPNALSPTTRPTTRPAVKPAALRPKPLDLPPKFAVLLTRSVFARNGKSAAAVAGPPIPEAGMALRGIVFDDTSFVAFIEDTMSHRTLQLRPGDSLCTGCVRQITPEGLSYECSGKTTHVGIGQNLLGAALPAPQPAPPAPAGSPPGPPGPPPPSAGPPPGGPI